MKFDPNHLAALSAVLRLGSFEAAAQTLLVTPSAISQRIKALEVQLKEAREKSQFFEAVIDVLKKDYGVRVVKKPVGKSSRKSPSKG